MSIANEIPTTVFVGQVPANKDDLSTWLQHLGSFINGSQAVKVKPFTGGSTYSLRNGAMVFVQGTATVTSGTDNTVEALPVAPLLDCFITMSVNGTVLPVMLTKDSRNITINVPSTTVSYSGWYLGANTSKEPR